MKVIKGFLRFIKIMRRRARTNKIMLADQHHTQRYTVREAAELLDINLSTLRNWYKLGYLFSVSISTDEHGIMLSRHNINQIILFMYLTSIGFSRPAASFCARSVKTYFASIQIKVNGSVIIAVDFEAIKKKRLYFGNRLDRLDCYSS